MKRELDSIPVHASNELPGVRRSSQTSVSRVESSDTRVALGLLNRHWPGVLAAVALLILVLGATQLYRRSNGSAPSPPSLLTLDRVRIDQLTSTGDAERPALAPDGKYMAYVRRQNGQYSLHVRQTTTAATIEIVAAEPDVVLYGATVSPDSGFVDYIRRAEGQSFELWRVPFLGGVSKRVLDRVNSPIGWSPDGQRFSFIRADATRGTDGSCYCQRHERTGPRGAPTARAVRLADDRRPAEHCAQLVA